MSKLEFAGLSPELVETFTDASRLKDWPDCELLDLLLDAMAAHQAAFSLQQRLNEVVKNIQAHVGCRVDRDSVIVYSDAAGKRYCVTTINGPVEFISVREA
jgi:hypothetical protein